MPTLQDVTLAHSRRLTEIHKARELEAADAVSRRDVHLRSLASAAKAYARFDEEVASARDKRTATEQKAAAARVAVFDSAIDHRGTALDEADAARRGADSAAMDARMRAEGDAERKYRDVLSAAGPRSPLAERQRMAREAERARRAELEAAQQAYTDALIGAQSGYRSGVDKAVLDERRVARDADRAYAEAVRLADVALRTAVTAAERTLNHSLSTLPVARDVVAACRDELAAITESARRAESGEFERFRRELDTVRS
jgi:hypothetical protein